MSTRPGWGTYESGFGGRENLWSLHREHFKSYEEIVELFRDAGIESAAFDVDPCAGLMAYRPVAP